MVWYPGAANHNIPPGSNDPPIIPRIVVVHTMVGTIESADAWFRGGSGGVEAHFGVAMDGRVWQWRDTDRQADAQAAGNAYCISIETEDGGHPETRWTALQTIQLDLLIRWLCLRYSIPKRLVRSTSDRGIGYHRQFSEWNPNRHSCPGDVRLAQLTSELIPALQGEEVFMWTAAEQKEILDAARQVNSAIGFGQSSFEGTIEADLRTTQTLVNLVKESKGTLAAAIVDLRTALLGAYAARPAPETDEQAEARTNAILTKLDNLGVEGLSPDAILEALRQHPLAPVA